MNDFVLLLFEFNVITYRISEPSQAYLPKDGGGFCGIHIVIAPICYTLEALWDGLYK